MNLAELTSKELLGLHAQILEVLRERNILHTSNNLVGDLAEVLFCQAYDWQREKNSNRGFDARDKKNRYQIKGRRCIRASKSHVLGAIRNFDDFDVLAVVIFSKDYQVQYAALIEKEVVQELTKEKQERTNSYRFVLSEKCEKPGILNVTETLKKMGDELLRTSIPFQAIQAR